jgi:hypothetical protein
MEHQSLPTLGDVGAEREQQRMEVEAEMEMVNGITATLFETSKIGPLKKGTT